MIFKQLKQGIDDVFAIGSSLTQINNLKLDATNITGYATALKGLTVKQAELVLSTKGLTVAQQQSILAEAELLGVTGRLTTAELNAILVNKKRNRDQAEALLIKTGLITAETSEATATNVVTAAKLKELVQTKALTQAEADLIAAKAGVTLANQKESASFLAGIGSKIKGLGSGLKSVGTGVLALAKAHPVIAAITTALTIGTVAVGIYKKKQEEAAEAIREAYENAKTAIEEVNSTFKNTESTTKQIAEEYAELAQGVNLLSNENKKLSTEKYERFLELSNQLSTLYPSLTKNYDENGNAILDLSGDVDTIVGSLDDLIERQRALANQEIIEQMPDLFAGYTNNVADFKEQLDEAEKAKEAVQSAYDTISKYGIYTAFDINGNAKDANGDPVALKLGQYISLLETLGITAKQVNLKDSMGQIIGYKLELEDGSDMPNISGIHDAYVSQFNKTIDDVKYAKMQLDSETSSINQYLNTWLQTEFSYNQLESDGLQKAIQETLFNFDWSSLPEGIDKNDWEAVSEYLRRNVLFSINNIDDTDVSQALADIYTGALTSGELLNAISKVQEYFGEEHPISVALEPKVNDVQPLVNSVKDLLKGTEFDDKVGELSLDNLKIASELDVPLDSIESWEELLALIQKVKDEARNSVTASFSDIFALKDTTNITTKLGELSDQIDELQKAYTGLKKAMDSYKETGTFTLDQVQEIISYGGEYLKYLMDENGNLQLNEEALNNVAIARINEMRAKALSNLMDNLDNITNEESALEYLRQQLINTAEGYDELTESRIRAWLFKTTNSDITDATQEKLLSSFRNQANAINEMFDNISIGSIGGSSTKDAEKSAKEYVDSYMEFMKSSLETNRIDFRTYSNDVSAFLKKMFDEGKISGKEYFDYVQEQLETEKKVMGAVISAVTYRIDEEIDRLKSEQDEIQNTIDALREANDEKERALELEKARYELVRLQSQRTKYIYTGERGFIYKTDDKAIREAQEKLKDLEFEEIIKGLENEKEALNDSIEELEKYKDKWNNIQKQHEININKMYAQDILGQNWEKDVLSGRLDTLNNFANNYFNIQKAIADAAWNSANEQIKAAQAAQNSTGGIVQTVNYESSYNSPAQIKPKASGYKVTTGGIDAARGFSSIDEAKRWATSHGISSSNYQTPSDIVYEVYLNGSLQVTKSTKEEAEEYLKQRYGIITKFAKGGVIGSDKSPLDSIAQLLGEDRIIAAKDGERILTTAQNENFEKLIGMSENLLKFMKPIEFAYETPNYSHLVNRNNTPSQVNMNVSINCPNVTNESGANYIKNELSSLTTKALQYNWGK